MNEYLDDAYEELKRVDHLIYVSLKYTRTVDVLKSIIDRMINAFDFTMSALLETLKEKKKIPSYSQIPTIKCQELMQAYSQHESLGSYLDFYLLLRKLSRADYTRSNEFRRHVTMTATVDGQVIEITIDIIHEYYNKAKAFIEMVQTMIEEVS